MRDPIAPEASLRRLPLVVAVLATLAVAPLAQADSVPDPHGATATDERDGYLVRPQDTLWGVADRLRPDPDISVQQMMLALFEHNPHAFDGRLDRLRAGARMIVPEREELDRYSTAEARTRVKDHLARPSSATTAAEPTGSEGYRVRNHETLWSIAERLRPDDDMPVRSMALALYDHNPDAFDGSIDRLRAGSVLHIPPTLAGPGGPGQAVTRTAGLSGATDENRQRTDGQAPDTPAVEDAETPRGFTFGEPARETPDAEDAAPPAPEWDVRVDDASLEAGVLASSDRPVNTTQFGRAIMTATRPLGEAWELRLGARADVQAQQGGDYPRTTRARADYDENFLRYRGDRTRVTVGTQRILWGRVDEIPPTDRLSTKDLTRFGLDPYAERRRANPAIRAEYFHGPWHADLVFLPIFRPAELPHRDSLWHPVDRNRGRLLGLPQDPALAPVIEQARLDDDVSGNGGAGVRLGRSGRGGDFAVTVQRARHSQPYYRFDPETREALAAGLPPSDPTLEVVHPRTWVVGGDTAFATGAWTWRAEAAWLSDVPVTRADDLRQTTVEGVDWVIGAEGFPGDGDFRMTTQLAGQHLLNAGDMLDARESYFLTGELESPFAAYNWRARIRYSIGLNRRDIYLNPEVAWIANEPMELYLGAHWLDGAEGTAGGFYRDNRMLVLGWRGQF